MKRMYVFLVELYYSGVISDGILVVTELREAVSPVIISFQIIRWAILQLIRVILDGLLEPLHLPVHQTTI